MNARTRWIVKTAMVTATIVVTVALRPVRAEEPTTRPAVAPAAERVFPYTGYVTGTNLRIRSGPDANYYPVTKLDTGDEVTVHDEQYGWLAITPPAGCFSLIDKEYVDKTAEDTGVVNGSNVWVRAGSLVSDQRYTRQVQLQRGDKIQILGETSDGAFYRITPPSGARVWVSGQFVSRERGAAPRTAPLAQHSPAPIESTGSMVRRSVQTESVRAPTTQPASPFGKYADEITALNEAIQVEAKKPITAQDFEPLVKRLRPIAAQDENAIAKLYAERRIEQLTTKTELASVLRDVGTLRDESATEHEVAMMARRSIKVPPETFLDDRVEARGELRPSTVFDPRAKATPQRYRLVDPTNDKTVAYIELPAETGIALDEYLGKYVSVRSNVRALTTGTVQPISVLRAEEIHVVPAKRFSPGMIDLPEETSASPEADATPAMEGPTTRPAPTAASAEN